MLLAWQNKFWGKNVEETTKVWLSFGIKHVMIKNTENFPLISTDGTVREKDFKKLGKLQEEYDVKYHFHPYNTMIKLNGEKYRLQNLDCLSNKTRLTFAKILKNIDELIQENNLYPLIVLHLPVLDYPGSEEKQAAEKALESGKEFFQSIEIKSTIGLETTHDPYRNPGFSLLGNKALHFAEIIGNKKNINIVIDTGHLNMAEEPLKKFIDLPYQIISLHFNGNDGKSDSHEIPNRNNMKDIELVEKLLKKIKGPIVFEIKEYSKENILKLIENTRNGKII
jgi:sugar phosphate isomerase/epimerase